MKRNGAQVVRQHKEILFWRDEAERAPPLSGGSARSHRAAGLCERCGTESGFHRPREISGWRNEHMSQERREATSSCTVCVCERAGRGRSLTLVRIRR